MSDSEITILVADDDSNTRNSLRRTLVAAGYEVVEAADGKEAMSMLTPQIAVALIDLKMPKADGHQCLQFAKENSPDTFIVVMSGIGKTDDVVKSMRRGAFWFLDKPFEKDDLLAIVGVAAELARLKKQNRLIKEAFGSAGPEQQLIAVSPAMRSVVARAAKLVALDSTVLITGESGTGKTTLARHIHQQGPRREKPFISVSCASIPRDLLESELFGHEKGAFTGASRSRPGFAELAHEGTLFLDEVGELPLDLQPKLLTFLQDKRVRRVGGEDERTVDVRVIAATNRDLQKMCGSGLFREDLYYRLNVLALDMPNLATRREDIIPLAEKYLSRISELRNCPSFELTAGAKWELQNYPWQGNIRELENVLERTTAFLEGVSIGQGAISFSTIAPTPLNTSSVAVGLTLADMEKKLIRDTLVQCGGNKSEAADILGISLKTIYNKVQKFGL